ncbi:MAG: CvpA family protein [bacterium]
MDTAAITNMVLIGILMIGAAVGFAKGFLEQAIELLGVVAAFIIAILFGGMVARVLADRLGVSYSPALVVASIVLFFAGLMLTHFLAKLVGRAVKMTLLGWVDRFSGAMLGLLMAMIIASLLITFSLELPLPRKTQREIQGATVSLFLRPVAGQIYNWIVAHGSAPSRFEEIFKRSETI